MPACLRIGFAALTLLLVVGPLRAREPLVDQVKTAIDNGVRYLREIENNKGDFEHTSTISKIRPGGLTALATVALLQAGVSPDDELIRRCLKYLRGVAPSETYTVGLQSMVFAMAGKAEDRQLIQRNLKWLKDTVRHGGWSYNTQIQAPPDHSINQYALLGIHEAHLVGLKMDRNVLQELHEYYDPPNATGAWRYRTAGQASLTMTTAGLCNLIITGIDLEQKRKLVKGVDANCGEYPDEPTINKALGWIAGAIPNDIRRSGMQHPFYALYGIERAGRLTGRRFLGPHDWYRIGCEWLVETQKKNGSWDGNDRGLDHWPPVATSLSLLFLSKGRTPVLISKLAHGDAGLAGQAWNNKRHDVRHLVEFCSREIFKDERGHPIPLAWQVFDSRHIPLKRDGGRDEKELAEDLLQTPVLYINGHTLTQILDKREEKVLQEYLENGGFIFAEACCGSGGRGSDFDRQFRALIKRITDTELTEVPANHPVWEASGKFKVRPGSFGLEGVNKGCKMVVMYSPQPISGWWENNDTESEDGKKAFHMAANIIAYATGMEVPKPRLTEVEIVRESEGKVPPRGYLQVAQLVPSRGTTPLAPKAIPTLMQEVAKSQLEVHNKAKLLSLTTPDVLDFKFFYFHDKNAFSVPSAAVDNLRFTLENGGLLLADAACGSKKFDESFRKFVEALWPKDKYPDRQLVPIDHRENLKKNELYSKEVNGFEIRDVRYRVEEPVPGEKDRTQPSKDFQRGTPRLEGVKINGRWAIIYSKYDIGCALEKHQSTDCLGHDYDSARTLARAAILYALRR